MFYIKYFLIGRFFYLMPYNFYPRKCQRSEIEIFTSNTQFQNTTIGDTINLVLGLLYILLSPIIL